MHQRQNIDLHKSIECTKNVNSANYRPPLPLFYAECTNIDLLVTYMTLSNRFIVGGHGLKVLCRDRQHHFEPAWPSSPSHNSFVIRCMYRYTV